VTRHAYDSMAFAVNTMRPHVVKFKTEFRVKIVFGFAKFDKFKLNLFLNFVYKGTNEYWDVKVQWRKLYLKMCS